MKIKNCVSTTKRIQKKMSLFEKSRIKILCFLNSDKSDPEYYTKMKKETQEKYNLKKNWKMALNTI